MGIERARELLSGVRQLPVLPEGATRLLQFSSSAQVTIEELLEIVEHDPVLTAMVLRIVNSAAFGLGRPVTNLSQAIVLLGTSHVRSLAIAASLSTALQHSDEASLETWRHSFAVACASRVVAQRVYPLESGTAFAAGLMHDLGQLVIATQFHDLDKAVDYHVSEGQTRHDSELDVIGATHPELGAALLEHWDLPEILQIGVLLHHGSDYLSEPYAGNTEGLGALIAMIVRTGEQLWLAHDGNRTKEILEDCAALSSSLGIAAHEALQAEVLRDVDRHLSGAGLSAVPTIET